MSITDKTRKMLWGRSGGRCAICRVELVMGATEKDDESVIGVECHIVAREEDWSRGDSPLTSEERDSYSNLILLCGNDHKIIDDQYNTYTVEKLQSIKAKHEEWVRNTLSTRETKSNKNQPIVARRIDTGRDLLATVVGSHMAHMNNEDLKDESEVELVGGFFGSVGDYGDLWMEMEGQDRTRATWALQEGIENLDSSGFLVYGCRRPEKHTFGEHALEMDVLYLFVLRKTNSLVKRNLELEVKLEFESESYSGEYAPFVIYFHE